MQEKKIHDDGNDFKSNNTEVLGRERGASKNDEIMREVEEIRENCITEGKREEVLVFCLFVCLNNRAKHCRETRYHEELRNRILDSAVSGK